MKIVKRVRKLIHIKDVILKKHQKKLIKFFHTNLVNPPVFKMKEKNWKNMLANLGQVKRTFNNVIEDENEIDKKILKQLLGDEDYKDFKLELKNAKP